MEAPRSERASDEQQDGVAALILQSVVRSVCEILARTDGGLTNKQIADVLASVSSSRSIDGPGRRGGVLGGVGQTWLGSENVAYVHPEFGCHRRP